MSAAVITCRAVPPPVGPHVVVRPAKWLGSLFSVFRQAMRGAVFNHDDKSYMVPRHAWPVVYGQLAATELLASLDELAKEWLIAAVDHETAHESTALNRIAVLDKRLQLEGKRLRGYQLEGIKWLATQRAALLLDEMGLGKSVQTICAIPGNSPVIIECPASLRLMWRDELRKWRPDLRPVVTPKAGRWPEVNEAFIVSDGWVRDTYALMQLPADGGSSEAPLQPLANCPPQVFLASDECHRFKGRSQRTEAMQAVCAAVRRANGSMVGLTGTPLMNRPAELYTLFLIFGCARKAFSGWGEYTKLWNAKKGRFKETIWGSPSPEVAERIASVSLRRTRAEVLPELPAKTYQVIPSEASVRLANALDNIEGTRFADTPEDMEAISKLVEYTALRVRLAHEKIPDMLEWVKRNSVGGLNEDDGSPLVVFSVHREPVEACGKLEGWRIITGDVSVKQRHDIVTAFQNGQLSGVAITLQSGGVGLTLTRSHRVLFVDRSFTPPDNWQGEDRVCRFGQEQPVLISRLVTDHKLERRLDEILELKSKMIAQAMGEVI